MSKLLHVNNDVLSRELSERPQAKTSKKENSMASTQTSRLRTRSSLNPLKRRKKAKQIMASKARTLMAKTMVTTMTKKAKRKKSRMKAKTVSTTATCSMKSVLASRKYHSRLQTVRC